MLRFLLGLWVVFLLGIILWAWPILAEASPKQEGLIGQEVQEGQEQDAQEGEQQREQDDRDGEQQSDQEEQGEFIITYDRPFQELGHYHHDQWTHLDIMIENTGQDKQGYLQIVREMGHVSPNEGEVFFEQLLEVGTGETVSVPMTVLNQNVQNNLYIQFVQEDEILQRTHFSGFAVSHEHRVALVSDEEQGYDVLYSLDLPYSPAFAVDDIPEEHWKMSHIPMLALAPEQEGELTAAQTQAIQHWVHAGGVLLLSASPGEEPLLADAFQSWLALDNVYTQEADMDTFRLEEMLETTAEEEVGQGDDRETPLSLLHFDSSLARYDYPVQEQPLFTGFPIGEGLVVLTTFDVTDSEVQHWQAYGELWEGAFEHFNLYARLGADPPFSQSVDAYSESMDIPGLEPPSLTSAAVIWVVYVLLAGPVLYIILKRRDKREWAWGIIPLIVLLTTGALYLVGMQRIDTPSSSHTVSDIRIHDEQTAIIHAYAGFFHLPGNEYSIDVGDGVYVDPWSRGINPYAFLKREDGKLLAHFEDVPYMSTEQVRGIQHTDAFGHIEHELYVEDRHLRGTLTNTTNVDLQDMHIQLGSQTYVVDGELSQQESTDIDIPLTQSTGVGSNHSATDRVETDPTVQHHVQHERFVEQSPMEGETEPRFRGKHETFKITAQSHTPVQLFDMRDIEEEKHYTHAIHQPLQLSENAQGRIVYPHEYLPVSVEKTEGAVREERQGLVVSEGSVVSALHVSQDLQNAALTIPLDDPAYARFELHIWQEDAQEWVDLSHERLTLSAEELELYSTSTGKILVRFEHKDDRPLLLQPPYFTLEGERT